MRSLSLKPFRLLLPACLLLLAACSQPSPPAKVSDVRAVAGPHYAQVYWTYPGTSGEFELEVRSRSAGGDWSNWAPATAEIDHAGRSALATVTRADEHEFRVGVWLDEQLQWEQAAESVFLNDGVTLQVGTMNRWDGDEVAGTVFLVYFDLPADVTVPLDLSFQGPPGWAAGAHPAVASVEHLEAGYIIEYLYALPPLPGRYTLTVTDAAGSEWTHSIEFSDDDFRLPLASELTITATDAAAGSVTAGWSPPVAGARTQVVLLDNADFTPVSDYVSTAATEYGFSGLLDLAAGQELLLEVTASNLVMTDPPVMPVPFGISVASEPFTVTD